MFVIKTQINYVRPKQSMDLWDSLFIIPPSLPKQCWLATSSNILKIRLISSHRHLYQVLSKNITQIWWWWLSKGNACPLKKNIKKDKQNDMQMNFPSVTFQIWIFKYLPKYNSNLNYFCSKNQALVIFNVYIYLLGR